MSDDHDQAASGRRRARIPQNAWSEITRRYRSGETLAQIARTYDCSPGAIAYVIRKYEEIGDQLPSNTETEAADTGATTGIENPAPAPGPALAPAAAQPLRPRQTGEGTSGRLSMPEPNSTPPAGDSPQRTLHLDHARAGATRVAALAPPAPLQAPRPVQAAPAPVIAASTGGPSTGAPSGAAAGETSERLASAFERVREAYATWTRGTAEGRQTLIDALHETRKVLARVEIEISAAQAAEHVQRPIPIPLHRAHRQGGGGQG